MNELVEPLPFDLHQLRSFLLVAERGSFTGAAVDAGLSQGSISRQIASLEDQLGAVLFDRTTREMRLTPAGEILLQDTRELLGLAQEASVRIGVESGTRSPTLKVGISRSLGLAPLPGLFANYRKQLPHVRIEVESARGDDLLEALRGQRLEVAVMGARKTLPKGMRQLEEFDDPFTLVVPAKGGGWINEIPEGRVKSFAKISELPWILPSEQTEVGRGLRRHLKVREWGIEAAMETDDFDLAVSLVSLGIGIAPVPLRVLPLYARRREVRRLELPTPFSRKLAVVARGNAAGRAHVQAFAEMNLFTLLEAER